MGNLRRWCLLTLALCFVGVISASDDLAEMKASMAKMQEEMMRRDAEMAKRDATVDALQNELNSMRMSDFASAGGEPAKLQSANGKATIRIGGEVRIRYETGWANGYNRRAQDGVDNMGNFKSQYAGWAIQRAELVFNIDLSKDTSAKIGLRLEGGSNGNFNNASAGGAGNVGGGLLNEAWWKWKNIGGVDGLQLMAGYMYMPFGMANNSRDLDVGGYSWSETANGIITKPFVMRSAFNVFDLRTAPNGGFVPRIDGRPFDNGAVDEDFATAGIVGAYQMLDKQLAIKAGIFAGQANYVGNVAATQSGGVNADNTIRNMGIINHVFSIAYNPCWVEGLHLEASYMGMFDNGAGVTRTAAQQIDPYGADVNYGGRTTYRPSFDFAVYYKTGNWKFMIENLTTIYSGYLNGSFANALTAGVDYNITKKLMISGEVDWMHFNQDANNWNYTAVAGGANANAFGRGYYYDIYRATMGLNYDFGNGLVFQLQYLHDFMHSTYTGDSAWKDNDTILFQSSYKF